MNTRILPIEYAYVAPQTLEEALAILDKKKDVKILAGGTDLIVKLKMGAPVPLSTMMDIKRIAALTKLNLEDAAGDLHIGAVTPLATIEEYPAVFERYPALYEALKAMASIAVRHMGTIGGNFGNASPASDTAGPVMAYDGLVKLVSSAGERLVPAKEFFTGPGKSVMAANELIAEIILPAPLANTGAAFLKKARVKADIAKISVTALLVREGNKIVKAALAMGSVAATPLFMVDIAQTMVGKTADKALFAQVAQEAAQAIQPIDDNRSTAEYRKAMGEVMVASALELAWKRAGGDL